MAKTAVCKLMLGRTRDAGWLVYDSSTYAFNELTNSEVRRLILDEGINGLEISSRGEIVLDRRFYLTRNMMARSGVGRYHLMLEDDTLPDTDEIFFLTKVMKFSAGTNIYEVVNNKCARLPFKVETVKRLYAQGILNGATDIDGEIIPCEGVAVENFGKEGNDADSLSDSWGDVVHGFGSNAACGAAESGQADISGVAFDDISDWLKEPEESEPEAALDEVETVEEQTKTPKKSSTTKKSKKGAVKSNARAKN